MDRQDCLKRLNGLVVFKNIKRSKPVVSFARLLDCSEESEAVIAGAYADFCESLFEYDLCWSNYLYNAVLQDENLYIKMYANGSENVEMIRSFAHEELSFLQTLSMVTSDEILKDHPSLQILPKWTVEHKDFITGYDEKVKNVFCDGYGEFAKYHVFTIQDGRIEPVQHPDPQKLSELPGYERERSKIIANTEALLDGMPANNVLLYGDAGTGKSSCIKAIANEYKSKGLRLIEVKKNQLYQIPDLMDELAANPLKFIIFIDDLSFTANDDNFAALKAILEGSVGGRSKNVAVYATSNRRHLIKETLSDREGDDIHHADTMQELMSLSARFGLTITFGRPDKNRFVLILTELKELYGIDMPLDDLIVKAEAFAIRAGGRSPRVAKQFIELVKSGVPV